MKQKIMIIFNRIFNLIITFNNLIFYNSNNKYNNSHNNKLYRIKITNNKIKINRCKINSSMKMKKILKNYLKKPWKKA